MNANVPHFPPVFDYGRSPIPLAAFEALTYLVVVAAASLAFVTGWLTINAGAALTAGLLVMLVVLSWVHLGQGRHPCFLFLFTLALFQGGRLIGYCLGIDPDPMRVISMTPSAFHISRTGQGITLLSLAVSAMCIYIPSRWTYRPIPLPDLRAVQQYLPFLYFIFLMGLPFLLYKHYTLYQLVLRYGGYTFLFSNQRDVAAKMPFLIRSASAILFPVFLAIYAFEARKRRLLLATIPYVATTGVLLLLGSRGAFFQLMATLWYVARVKSGRRPRIILLFIGALILAFLATAIRETRESSEDLAALKDASSVIDTVDLQGYSLDVTQIAVEYREKFAPFSANYLGHELISSYVTYDPGKYTRGELIDSDVSVLLCPQAFDLGFGAGGSYVGEAYIIGGLAGVVLISLLIGTGLRILYAMNARAGLLFVAAMLLFSAIWLPRGDLLAWVSALSRNLVVVALLWIPWQVYQLIVSIRHDSGRPELLPK